LQRILAAVHARTNVEKYVYLASVAEIAESDYNPRYVDTF
jgi:type I restriction enzyme M protein